MANPYYNTPYQQYPATAGVSTYDQLLYPGAQGPMSGTGFGRQQSPYAYMQGMQQPFQPAFTGAPPQMPQFLPYMPALGPMGNLLAQSIVMPLARDFLGGSPTSMQPYNVMEATRAQQYQLGQLHAMGIAPWDTMTDVKGQKTSVISDTAAYRDTEKALSGTFGLIGAAMHGGERGIRRQAEREVIDRLQGAEKAKYDEYTATVGKLQVEREELQAKNGPESAVKGYDTRISDTQALQRRLIDADVTKITAARMAETRANASDVARTVAADIYSQGPKGEFARAALMAIGNTSLGEGLQSPMAQMFMGAGMYQAGQALTGSPFGMGGQEANRLTEATISYFKNGGTDFDPKRTRGLRASEIGDMANQLAQRGLITGKFQEGNDEEQAKTKVASVRSAMERYTPLIDELGQLFTSDRGSVKKLLDDLEGMTAGMLSSMTPEKLLKLTNDVRKTSMLTGIPAEMVAQVTGQASAEARARGLSPELGFNAAQMGMRSANAVWQNQRDFGAGTYMGQASQQESIAAHTRLAMRGATSQMSHVIGGTILALQLAGDAEGQSREEMAKLSFTEQYNVIQQHRQQRGAVTDAAKDKMMREGVRAIDTGDVAELRKYSKNRGAVAWSMGALDLTERTAATILFDREGKIEELAQAYEKTNQAVAGSQAETALDLIAKRFGGRGGLVVAGKRVNVSELTHAVFSGAGFTEKDQQRRAEAELIRQGVSVTEAMRMAPQVTSNLQAATTQDRIRDFFAGTQDGRGATMGERVNEMVFNASPQGRWMQEGREAAAEALLSVDTMARAQGLGATSLSQRIISSLSSDDGQPVGESLKKVIGAITPAQQTALQENWQGLQAGYKKMQTRLSTAKTDEEKQAIIGAYRTENKETIEKTKSLLGELITPDVAKKIAKEDQESKAAAVESQSEATGSGKPLAQNGSKGPVPVSIQGTLAFTFTDGTKNARGGSGTVEFKDGSKT